MPLFLLLLIGLPLIEIAVFVEVGESIGAGWTIILTVLTALWGIALVRIQGLQVLYRMQTAVDAGEPPVAELVHGFFLLIAGFLLLIPGFVGDAVGALFLIPQVRLWLGRHAISTYSGHRRPRRPGEPTIIEGDFWEDEDDDRERLGRRDRDDRDGGRDG